MRVSLWWPFLALLGTWATPAARAGVDVPYIGHEVTHVVYSHANPQALAVEFRVKRPDQDWTVRHAGLTSVSGQIRDDHLAHGAHGYEIREQVREPNPADPEQFITVWRNAGSATATVDGRQVGGTLHYDETFATTTTVARTVSVPEGLALSIGPATIKATPDVNIEVSGDIAIDPRAVVDPNIILQSHAFHLDTPGRANLIFLPATAGSSITGGTNLYAEFYHNDFTLPDCGRDARIAVVADDVSLSGLRNVTLIPNCTTLTLAGMSNIWLELAAVDGAVAIDHSAIRFTGFSQPTHADNRFDFDAVTWSDGTPEFHRPVTLKQCDFQAGVRVVNTTLAAGDTAFGSLTLEKAAAGTRIERCFVRGVTAVYAGAPELRDCECAGTVILYNRSAAQLERNILLDGVLFANATADPDYFPMWHTAVSPSPVIRDNSFLGERAFEWSAAVPALQARVEIGPNYYGDPGGLRSGSHGNEYLGWEHAHEGAWLVGDSGTRLQLAPQQPAGRNTRQDRNVFPRFWLNGWIAGQNTIRHHGDGVNTELMQGRDTLLSVELLTSDADIRNVKVYAECAGQRFEAKFSGPLQRDLAAVRPESIWMGMGRTFDIVVPWLGQATLPVSVYADLTRVTGFAAAVTPTNPAALFSTTFRYTLEPPTRDLTISVVPVKLAGLLFSSGPPGAGAVAQVLKKSLPAMFPIPADRVQVRVDPPVTVPSSGEWVSALPLMYKISAVLAGRNTVCGAFLGNPTYKPADFTVAILPEKSLHVLFGWGKADGANTKIFRDIVLVDERNPSAVVHELGHAMGLYQGQEQYDLYPPSGRRIEAVTAFWTDSAAPAGKFNAFNHALHFPGSWYGWYRDFDWFDVMGNVDETIWPSDSTQTAFREWFQGHLYPAGAAPLALADGPRALGGEPPAGQRRVLLQGQATNIAFVAHSLSIFDVTGQNLAALAPPTNGPWQARHYLRAYTAAAALVHETECYIPAAADPVQSWVATVDMPATARKFAIERWDSWSGRTATVAVWRARGTLTNRILAPAPGAAVGNQLEAAWQGEASGDPGGSNLTHLVLFSADGGATWLNPTLPQAATRLTAQTDFLPPCGNLAIRVVTSDGFTNCQTTLAGLSVPNRPPVVAIAEPREGDVAATGTVWRLLARRQDYDGNLAAPGVWSSSLQGVLGSNELVQCALAEGAHTLRYTAADDLGLAAAATVRVTVAAAPAAVNLGLASNALQLTSASVDPVSPVPVLLRVDATNRLSLRFRTQAVAGSVRVSLSVQPPGGPATLLKRETLAFAQAGWDGLAATYVPTRRGPHRFTATLDQVVPADPDATDNTRTWTFDTRNPALTPSYRFVQLGGALPPGQTELLPGETFKPNWRIDVANTGVDDLLVGTPSFTGPNAANCRVYNNQVTGVTIPPTGTRYLFVECGATARGFHRSTLVLPSNDPAHPLVTVEFLVALITADQNVDTDRDGLYDGLEALMGTRADRADTDGDGLADGVKDLNRNGVVDAGETSALVADTDADGLADGQEDANRNGSQDYGETRPDTGDSDGDGMGDGDEGVAGTHPFLADDVLFGEPTPAGNGVRWNAVAGRTYRVMRAAGLLADAWTNAPAGAGPAGASRRVATESGPLEYRDPEPSQPVNYYRIRVRRTP